MTDTTKPREWIREYCENHIQNYDINDEPIWIRIGEFINEYDNLLEENKRLRAALEWIKKSGEILYRNELENEPYLKLVWAYRKHKDVAAKALCGEGIQNV